MRLTTTKITKDSLRNNLFVIFVSFVVIYNGTND
jgi:hypothetical protein